MEEGITVTRSQVISALQQWELDSVNGEWKARTDPGRFADSADYFIDLLKRAAS